MAEEKMTHDDMNDEEARELLKKINNEEDLGGRKKTKGMSRSLPKIIRRMPTTM